MSNSDGAYRLLDVGGSFVKCADGRVIPIASAGSREAIAASLRAAVGNLEGVRGIGVAIPGPFDFRAGIFRMEHKFAAVKGLSFRELAGIPEGVPMRFGHDVNTLLEGAVRMLGLGGNTALVTLGTGLGFAHAIRGEVQYGPTGSPARHLYNLPWGDGILEDAVSARGLRRSYAAKTGDTLASALTIAQRAYAGEEAALEAFSEMGTLLGQALSEVTEELAVDTVLFAGQISRSLSLMDRPLKNALEGVRTIGQAPEGAVYKGLEVLFEKQ